MALTKSQVNERFYDTVGGEIVFETEAQGYLHPYAVAKLLAAHSRGRGTRDLKLLELGANNCAFATSLLKLLTTMAIHGEVELERIDYFAVELARRSLEAFMSSEEAAGFQRVEGVEEEHGTAYLYGQGRVETAVVARPNGPPCTEPPGRCRCPSLARTPSCLVPGCRSLFAAARCCGSSRS